MLWSGKRKEGLKIVRLEASCSDRSGSCRASTDGDTNVRSADTEFEVVDSPHFRSRTRERLFRDCERQRPAVLEVVKKTAHIARCPNIMLKLEVKGAQSVRQGKAQFKVPGRHCSGRSRVVERVEQEAWASKLTPHFHLEGSTAFVSLLVQ